MRILQAACFLVPISSVPLSSPGSVNIHPVHLAVLTGTYPLEASCTSASVVVLKHDAEESASFFLESLGRLRLFHLFSAAAAFSSFSISLSSLPMSPYIPQQSNSTMLEQASSLSIFSVFLERSPKGKAQST